MEEIIKNRAFLYGDAVFDVLKVVHKKIYFWEEHYLRLMANMRIVRMEIPDSFTMEFLENEIIQNIINKNLENQSVIVRISIVRSQAGEYAPESNNITYYIDVIPSYSVFYENKEVEYEVELYKDFFLQPDLISNIKTNNRIINVMASVFAQENDYQNCILLNAQKNVVGFLDGNLFLVSQNHIKTPALNQGCINGITRKKLIEIIKKMPNYTIEETAISPFDLQKSDEIFVTNTTNGIQSVTKYRKKIYTNIVAKELVGRLNTMARLG